MTRPRRPQSRGVGVALAVVAALAAAACSDGATPAPTESVQIAPSLDALDDAITAVNAGRAAVLRHVATVITALERRDELDDLAAAGERTSARSADPASDESYARVAASTRDLGPALEEFQRGLGQLAAAAASPELDTAQRRLLGTAIAHGRAEVAATRAFATQVRAALPAYDELGVRVDEWLRRARAGWYRDQQEAANAYVVLLGDVRERLEAARGAVAHADSARTRAVADTTRSFSLARRALAPLMGRPTEVPLSPTSLPG